MALKQLVEFTALAVGCCIASACGVEATNSPSASVRDLNNTQVCIVDYVVPADYTLAIGQIPFETQRETFCSWRASTLRTSFVSNSSCKEEERLQGFDIRKVEGFQIAKAEGICVNARKYDLRQSKKAHRSYEATGQQTQIATIRHFGDQLFSVMFELEYANQRQGFPMEAIYFDDDSIAVYLASEFSPWRKDTCSALLEHMKGKLPAGSSAGCG
jgi:hypothetical protein